MKIIKCLVEMIDDEVKALSISIVNGVIYKHVCEI